MILKSKPKSSEFSKSKPQTEPSSKKPQTQKIITDPQPSKPKDFPKNQKILPSGEFDLDMNEIDLQNHFEDGVVTAERLCGQLNSVYKNVMRLELDIKKFEEHDEMVVNQINESYKKIMSLEIRLLTLKEKIENSD